jgi:hypothetical protein
VLTPNQVLWIKFQVFTGSPIHPPLGALTSTTNVLAEAGPSTAAPIGLVEESVLEKCKCNQPQVRVLVI